MRRTLFMGLWHRGCDAHKAAPACSYIHGLIQHLLTDMTIQLMLRHQINLAPT